MPSTDWVISLTAKRETSGNASSQLKAWDRLVMIFFHHWSSITAHVCGGRRLSGGASVSWHAILSSLCLQRPRTTDGSQRSHVFKSGVQMDTSSCSKSWAPWHWAASERGESRPRPILLHVDIVILLWPTSRLLSEISELFLQQKVPSNAPFEITYLKELYLLRWDAVVIITAYYWLKWFQCAAVVAPGVWIVKSVIWLN